MCNFEHTWYLGNQVIQTTNEVELLRVTIDSTIGHTKHVDSRVNACRRGMYGLTSIDMTYPGLGSDVKAHLWNTIGALTLMYGLESLNLRKKEINYCSSSQRSIIKRISGISNRSPHSNLLHALNIPIFSDLLQRNTASLYHRIFKVKSLTGDLQARFLATYLLSGNCTKGSLLERIIISGRSPIDVIFNEQHFRCPSYENGVIDSLRYLLHHENFVKPWSSKYLLAGLLTKAF